LAHRIRSLRERAGLTQKALAHASGLSGVFMGTIERAEKSASIETVEKVARGLGVPPFELLRFDSTPGDADPADRLARKIAGLARGEGEGKLRKFERLARVFFEPDKPDGAPRATKRSR